MQTAIAPRDEYRSLIYMVLDALGSDHSRRAYHRALEDFLTWYTGAGKPGLSRATVQRYKTVLQAEGLAPRTINQRMSAVRKLAAEAAANGYLDPVAAGGIADVAGVATAGVRLGNWLSREDAQRLLNTPDITTLMGLRDRAMLAVMVGAGLRRSEVAALEFGHIAQRDGRWVIVDLVGKGSRVRSVPIPGWTKMAIDTWAGPAGLAAGRVFRSMNKADRLERESVTPGAINEVVKRTALAAGLAVSAHDLRRTYAKLARAGGSPLEQIQLSLGHASIQTTERYLGGTQDLVDAPGDRLGLGL
jgi:integrase